MSSPHVTIEELSSRAPVAPAGRRLLGCCLLCVSTVLLLPQWLLAQELPFLTSYPGAAPYECPPWVPPAPADRADLQAARELSSSATQAVVLGDLARATELLTRAAELDGASPENHYGLGRVLEDTGEDVGAIEAYCRVLALEPKGDIARDAAMRRDALVARVRDEVPFAARMAFERGVGSAERGRFTEAARSFAAAEEQAPDWSVATYNQGVALARSGRPQEAAERLRRYLEQEPEAEDAVDVARRIGQLEMAGSRPARPPSPTVGRSNAALTLGLLVPGLGQFYSGRSGAGLVVFSAAAGAVATGLLVKEVNVRCLTLPEGGTSCPPGQVVSRRTDRPLLGKALVAAGAISLLGVVEAWFRADSEGGPSVVQSEAREGITRGPSLSVNDRGGMDLVLLGFSLR